MIMYYFYQKNIILINYLSLLKKKNTLIALHNIIYLFLNKYYDILQFKLYEFKILNSYDTKHIYVTLRIIVLA